MPLSTPVFLATLCYHSQIKLVKPLRLLLGQHLTHFTLVRKPSEISQVTIYTPLYLRIVDQYRYFICCGLDMSLYHIEILARYLTFISCIECLNVIVSNKFQLRYLPFSLYTIIILSMLASQRQT